MVSIMMKCSFCKKPLQVKAIRTSTWVGSTLVCPHCKYFHDLKTGKKLKLKTEKPKEVWSVS